MASLTAAMAGGLCALIMQAVTLNDYAENDTTTPLATFYLSLHTGSPAAGNQATSEAAYTSYARASIDRVNGAGGWDRTGGVASPNAAVDWATGSGGGETASHLGIGRAASSTGTLDFSGTLTPNITTGSGVTPRLGTGTTITFA